MRCNPVVKRQKDTHALMVPMDHSAANNVTMNLIYLQSIVHCTEKINTDAKSVKKQVYAHMEYKSPIVRNVCHLQEKKCRNQEKIQNAHMEDRKHDAEIAEDLNFAYMKD
jgi:hypothetical protein